MCIMKVNLLIRISFSLSRNMKKALEYIEENSLLGRQESAQSVAPFYIICVILIKYTFNK